MKVNTMHNHKTSTSKRNKYEGPVVIWWKFVAQHAVALFWKSSSIFKYRNLHKIWTILTLNS